MILLIAIAFVVIMLGAFNISHAIENFKDGSYFRFGMYVMVGIIYAGLILKLYRF